MGTPLTRAPQCLAVRRFLGKFGLVAESFDGFGEPRRRCTYE